jgi:predicted nucleic-acid-binding Zn-ribbon protein
VAQTIKKTKGILTPAQQEAIHEWLRDKWTTARGCPFCGNTKWTIQNQLGALILMDKSGNMDLSSSYPNVVVTCDNCKYTVLFNAVPMDVLPKEGVVMEEDDA